MGHHPPNRYGPAFAIAISLNLAFVVIEVIYALLANSSSLLADAGHNFGDIIGLALAAGANGLLMAKPRDRFSYGFKKTTILAAILNACILVATSAVICFEAISKLISPEHVNELTVAVVAAIGIAINGGSALLFMKNDGDLNIKGAFLHLAYDAMISLGVVVAAVLIYFTGYYWLDPLVGLFIVIAILLGAWGLLRDSVILILDAVPSHVDINQVNAFLLALPDVKEVHDLHIWGLSTNEVALTAHLVITKDFLTDDQQRSICNALRTNFYIEHVTLQMEHGTLHHDKGHTQCC
ncbi:MAG: cation diffusion facilitator family transporter [Gammaproteobacteria bacterium]